ncbi:hypothetical protein [Nocardia sp. NPDC004711]
MTSTAVRPEGGPTMLANTNPLGDTVPDTAAGIPAHDDGDASPSLLSPIPSPSRADGDGTGSPAPAVPFPAGDASRGHRGDTAAEAVPAVPEGDPHAAALAALPTKRAQIQYAVNELEGAPPAEVITWLAGYGINAARSKVSPEVSAYKAAHGIPDTGEHSVITVPVPGPAEREAGPGDGAASVGDTPAAVPSPVADLAGHGGDDYRAEGGPGWFDQRVTSTAPSGLHQADTEPAVPLVVVPDPAEADTPQGWGHHNGHPVADPVGLGGYGHSVPAARLAAVPADAGDASLVSPPWSPGGDGTGFGVPGVPAGEASPVSSVSPPSGWMSPGHGDGTAVPVPTARAAAVPTVPTVPAMGAGAEEAEGTVQGTAEGTADLAAGLAKGTGKRKAPAGEFGFYLASAVAMITSLDTSWRLFSITLGVANPIELVAMFAGLEISFVACAYHMGMSIRRRKEEPIPFVKTALWILMCIAAVGAWINAGPLLGTARIAAGPGLAMLMLHLALSTERQANSSERGTLAKIGAEIRERVLSRLGLGNDDRDAAQRSRDRAAQRAAMLNAAPFAFMRTTRVRRAMRAARVASDPSMMDKMLAEYDIEKHAPTLRTLKRPNPFARFDQKR